MERLEEAMREGSILFFESPALIGRREREL